VAVGEKLMLDAFEAVVMVAKVGADEAGGEEGADWLWKRRPAS
jgi:hypothetical protein